VDYFEILISRHAARGVVLDTNVFLLYVVGALDPQLLPQIKRTASFEIDDWKLLKNLLLLSAKTIVTPGIITEACNLLDSANAKHHFRLFSTLQHLTTILLEDYVRSQTLSQHKLFSRFGLADCSIAHLGSKGHLIITDDLRLKIALEQMSIPVLNFNNLRAADWMK
jgi:hypothetical protein